MRIDFDPLTMPMPAIIAFTCAEGLKIGKPIEWINKLWRVQLKTGMSCFVSPSQIEWMV